MMQDCPFGLAELSPNRQERGEGESGGDLKPSTLEKTAETEDDPFLSVSEEVGRYCSQFPGDWKGREF